MKNVTIWLGGVGRSEADLARLVDEVNSGAVTQTQNRRSHERHMLNDAHGQLIYRGKKTPCQIVEISAGGCRVKVESQFCYGALADIEVVLPILGLVFHIGGVTQWTKKDTELGIRFTHVSLKSKLQVQALIDCLIGKRTTESIIGTITSVKLNQNTGDVLIVQPMAKASLIVHTVRPPYDKLVHCGEGLVRTPKPGEWPVALRSPDGRSHAKGDIADLSMRGCTIQTATPFVGELKDVMEVEFELRGLHFVTNGEVSAIYGSEIIGIQFACMTARKRDQLTDIIGELCTANRTCLQFA